MLEADFQRFYQLRLRDLCWGTDRIGVRLIAAYVSGLPFETAASWRQERNAPAAAAQVAEKPKPVRPSALFAALRG